MVNKIWNSFENSKMKKSALPIVSALLALFAIAALVVKNVMVGADTDEGYAIVLAYRLVQGDRLILDMWEPHQTSAIFTALLMKPFLWIGGGRLDYLNIYLRVVFFVLQAAVSLLLYRMLRRCFPQLGVYAAAALAGVYFCNIPKCICIPEYSNLHNWFFALLSIALIHYFRETSPCHRKPGMLLAAGVALLCDVLAYPSMVLLVPVCLLILWQMGERSIRNYLLLLLPGILGAACLAGYLFSYLSPKQMLEILPYILGDKSHQFSVWDKLLGWARSFGKILLILGVSFGVAAIPTLVLYRRKEKKRRISRDECFLILFFAVQMAYQIYCWFFGSYNASHPHTIYLAFALMGIPAILRHGQEKRLEARMLMLCAIQFLGIMLFSNWAPIDLIPYVMVGCILGIAICDHLSSTLVGSLCTILLGLNCFGYCYLIIGGAYVHDDIGAVNNRFREGFRKGIYGEYINGDTYNSNLQAWKQEIEPGARVLYLGPNQYCYLLGDCVIASPSTISTPSYDDSVLKYWELHPDRYPDYVVVESWHGDIVIFPEGSFYTKWIEEEFCPGEIIQYPYITIFKK